MEGFLVQGCAIVYQARPLEQASPNGEEGGAGLALQLILSSLLEREGGIKEKVSVCFGFGLPRPDEIMGEWKRASSETEPAPARYVSHCYPC